MRRPWSWLISGRPASVLEENQMCSTAAFRGHQPSIEVQIERRVPDRRQDSVPQVHWPETGNATSLASLRR